MQTYEGMITLIFEAHGTTFDNEQHLSSGWNDVELSSLGIKQSKEMGIRYAHIHLDAIFCSDLKRSIDSTTIAFEGRNIKIIVDQRLRECNYGDFTQHPSAEVDKEKPKRIATPFPKGESYEQCADRMKLFLHDIQKNYEGKTVMIIGHRATQYSLEHWINHIPLKTIIPALWKWQPGWKYGMNDDFQ